MIIPQQVPFCTTGVHDQFVDICIQGYLWILWIRNTKSLKNKIINFEYFLKDVKLTPEWVLYATSDR